MSPAPAVILFDGVCNLCNASVAFVIARDRRALFRFAPLQSAAARRLLAAHHVAPGTLAAAPASDDADPRGVRPRHRQGGGADDADEWQSVVLIDEGRVYQRSTAALRVLRRLGFPWSLAAILLIVPAPLRDRVYARIARHRYRWFGRRDTCAIPTPDQRARFLD